MLILCPELTLSNGFRPTRAPGKTALVYQKGEFRFSLFERIAFARLVKALADASTYFRIQRYLAVSFYETAGNYHNHAHIGSHLFEVSRLDWLLYGANLPPDVATSPIHLTTLCNREGCTQVLCSSCLRHGNTTHSQKVRR